MTFTLEDVRTKEDLDLNISLDNKLLQDVFLQLKEFFEKEGYPDEYEKPPSSFGGLITNPFPGIEFKSDLKPYRFDYVVKIRSILKDIKGSKDLLDIIVSQINQVKTQRKEHKTHQQEQADLMVELKGMIELQKSYYDDAILKQDEDAILQIENEISKAKKGIRFSTLRYKADTDAISIIDKNLMILIEINKVVYKRYNEALLVVAEKEFWKKFNVFLGDMEEFWAQRKKVGFYALHVEREEKENLMTAIWDNMQKRIT